MNVAVARAAVLAVFCAFPFAGHAAEETKPKVDVVLPISRLEPLAPTFSPDGRFLVAADHEGGIELWNVGSGELIRNYRGHTGLVQAIAFSPDGQFFASTGSDHTIRIWHVTLGNAVNVLDGGEDTGTAIAFSPDGSMLVAGDNEGNVVLWTFEGKPTGRRVALEGGVVLLGFDTESDSLVVVTRTGAGSLIDLKTMEVRKKFAEKFGEIGSAAMLPDGHSVLVAANDGTLSQWNTEYGDLARTFAAEPADNYWIVVSPDGKRAFTSVNDAGSGVEDSNEVIVWDVATGTEKKHVHFEGIDFEIAIAPDGKTVAIGAPEGIMIRDADDGHEVKWLTGATYAGERISRSADGRLALTATKQRMRVWEIASGKTVAEFKQNQPDAAISPDGNYVLAGTLVTGQPVRLWDAAGASLKDFDIIGDYDSEDTYRVSFSSDGKVAAADTTEALAFLDIESLTEIGRVDEMEELNIGPPYKTAIALAGDGKTIAVGYTDGGVALRTVPDFKLIRKFKGLQTYVSHVRFSDDGKALIGADISNNVALWTAKTGKLILSQETPSRVQAAGLTPDGSQLYVATYQGALMLVTLAGRRPMIAAAYDATVDEVVFAPDGKTVTGLTEEGTTVTSSLATGERLATRLLMKDGDAVTVTPEGFFDGPEGSARKIRLVRGLEVFPIDAAYDALHRPDLVAAKLAGDPDGLVKAAYDELDFNALLEGQEPIGGSFKPVPKKPTHVVVAAATAREKPEETSAGVGDLAPGTQVAVIEAKGDWTLVARDGKLLGYVSTSALAALQ